jgi:serine/threonine protein kinase
MSSIPKLLSEGSYGCIFRPGINCQGSVTENDKYVTKMISEQTVTNNEKHISDIIQKIPDYEERFAPIIENCSVDLATIDSKTISECEMVRGKDDMKIELNKIKYVGKNTLGKYLILEVKENPERFLEILLESHMILLENLEQLYNNNIVHNDLKENNIVCRDGDGRPIIIDFGLSIDKERARLPETTQPTSSLYEYFFKYTSDYAPWCIDIVLINYMICKLNEPWLRSKITQDQINELVLNVSRNDRAEALKLFSEYAGKPWETLLEDLQKGGDSDWLDIIYVQNGYKWRNIQIKEGEITQIIDDFMKNNPLFGDKQPLLKPEDIDRHKNNIKDYLKSSPDLTWEELLNQLLENAGSWDNYALAVIYIKLIKIIGIEWPEYEKILIDIIVANPKERMGSKDTKKRLLKVLQTPPKTIVESLKQLLKVLKYNEIEEKLKTVQLEEVQREKP